MTIRNVKKSLAGMQDLVQGVGDITQDRNNQSLAIAKVDVPYAVLTEAEMQALEILQYTRARVYSSTTAFNDYIYDPLATAGISSNTGAGFWVAVTLNNAPIYHDTEVDATADTSLQVGDVVILKDRASATFDVITGTGTANTFNIIAHSTLSLSLALRESGSPILEQYGVSTSGSATNNANAIIQAIANGGGSFQSEIAGEVDFDVPIVVTGSGRTISLNAHLKFIWTGATAATAWSFGDGVLSTRGIEIHNFALTDGSAGAGVDILLHLNKCVSCQFYSPLLTSNGVRTNGVGLKTTFAFINTFYSMQIANLWDSWELANDTNSNSFYDLNIEGCQNDGVVLPTGVSVTRNNFFGGTIESVTGNAVRLSSPGRGMTFNGTYFELNGTDILADMAAAETIPVSLLDCRFKNTVNTASVVVSGLGRFISERCNNDGQELFDVTASGSWIKGTDNISESSDLEFTVGSVGNLISSSISGSAIKYSNLRILELVGYTVPVVQVGSEVLAVGSSTVVFAKPFKNTPQIITQIASEHAAGTVANVITVGVNVNQVTFRNRGTETVTINWVGFDSGDLN